MAEIDENGFIDQTLIVPRESFCHAPAYIDECFQKRVFGAWCLWSYFWQEGYDTAGNVTVKITFSYLQVTDAYPKAPAQARLDLIKAGFVPQSILRGKGG